VSFVQHSGVLGASDLAAKVCSINQLQLSKCQSTYQISSAPRITKAGKPATLDDGVIDEPVSGFDKPTDDGKLTATTVHSGAKVEEKGSEQKKTK
jgi:hypothetical protein